MENFIFSLNGTLPIFAVMLLGIFARRSGILNDDYVARANKLNFYTAMPAMLFMSMYGKDLKSAFDIKAVIIVIISLLIAFVLAFLIARFFVKDKYMRGSFAQGAFRGNTALIGIALINNMYGSSATAAAVVAFVVPIYNIAAVIFLSVFPSKGEEKKKSVKSMVKGILTNPLIIGTVTGALSAVIGLKFPVAVERTLGYLSDMATGTALICIGASMKFAEFRARWKTAMFATVLKLVVFPLMLLPAAVYFGCRADALMAIYIALGSPAAVNSYIMAKSMNHDGDLASGIIVLSALLGSVTMTLWVFVMRSMGLV